MATETPPEAPAVPDNDEAAQQGLFKQVSLIAGAIYQAGVARALIFLVVGLFLVIAATAYSQTLINAWNKPFYDALSRRDLHEFITQLGVFFLIITGLTVLNVMQRWLSETLKLKLREGLLRDLVRDSLSEVEARVMTLHYAEELPLDAVTRLLKLDNTSGAKAYIVSAKRKLTRAVARWKPAARQ